MLSGDNGLLQRVREAKISTDIAKDEETWKLALSSANMKKVVDGTEITKQILIEELEKNGVRESEIEIEEDIVSLTFKFKSGYEGKYKIENNLAILDVQKFRNKFFDGDGHHQSFYNVELSKYGFLLPKILYTSFEKSSNLPNNIEIDKNVFSTTSSGEKLYVWFEKKDEIDLNTFGDGIQKCDSGILYWYTNGIPTLTGDLHGLFDGYYGETLNLTDWNLVQASSMEGMFADCVKLKNIQIGKFDTSNVTNISSLFNNCLELENINLLNSLNLSNAQNFQNMFGGCISLKNIDLSFLNLSKASDISISAMFMNCINLKKLDFTKVDTKNVKSTGGLFSNCINLEEVDFTRCTFNGTNFGGMFQSNCKNLQFVNFSGVDMSSSSIGGLFGGSSPERIVAPINVQVGMGTSVGLPGTQYSGSDGKTYTGLPEGLSSSILLTKK